MGESIRVIGCVLEQNGGEDQSRVMRNEEHRVELRYIG